MSMVELRRGFVVNLYWFIELVRFLIQAQSCFWKMIRDQVR